MVKRGQIWIETVIYTLIALIMIGAVLGFARPKIQEIQDKLTIDKSFEMLQEIDAQVSSVVEGGAGNKRTITIEVKKGEINIASGKIIFTIGDSKSVYSEPGEEITIDKIKVKTEQTGDVNTVTLTLDYEDTPQIVTRDGSSIKLTKSPSPYKLSITNNGGSEVEFKIIS